ncbi:hypothetical protein C8F01DRAFT_1134577 [Mycena amicta]|nr:hypothetical protein C8F01DRAFT_1134577 [Mycena amicta]
MLAMRSIQFNLATLFPCLVAGQVTLWQFGALRLFGGEVTLPLVPQGTAAGGGATTYLYQAVNPATVVTVQDNLFVTQTIPVTGTRTIIASASGWFEMFPDRPLADNIACGFVDSTFGECFDGNLLTTTLANSGPPTPVVLAVSALQPASNPTSSLGGMTLGVASSTGATASPSSSSSKPSAGPIVGCVLAGVALLALAPLALILYRRRRRIARENNSDVEKPQPFNLNESVFGFGMGSSSQGGRNHDEFRGFSFPFRPDSSSPPGLYLHRQPHAPQRSMSSTEIFSEYTISNADSSNRPAPVIAHGTNMTTPIPPT